MPRFLTISPTHIPGKKRHAWQRCRDEGYVAIGWMDEDLQGKPIQEVEDLIRSYEFPNETSALDSFRKFLTLEPGDYVAVNNVSHGLFGIGQVTSEYRFSRNAHDTGAEDPQEWYSHLRNVEWEFVAYVKREDIVAGDETSWAPYGTVGALHDRLPPYVERLLGRRVPTESDSDGDDRFAVPAHLQELVEAIKALRADSEHLERAHESLVEDFLVAIGYQKHRDIKYRRGRVDISIWSGGKPTVLFEVKRDWDISLYSHGHAIQQAYRYALEQGTRFVAVTNGDDYLLFDRLKGLTIESNLLGGFRLTEFAAADLSLIDRLRADRLMRPDLDELFRHLAECFETGNGA